MTFTPRTKFVQLESGQLGYQVIDGGTDGCVVWFQTPVQHLDLFWTDDTIVDAFEALARDGLTSILFQERGVGISDSLGRKSTLEEQAADLIAVLDAEGIGQATLVSTGSTALPVSLVAAQYPDRVRGIVMIGPTLVGPLVSDSEYGWTPQLARECIDGYRRAAANWGSGEVLALWDRALATPYNVRLMGMAERCSVSPEMGAAVVEHWLGQDGREIYPEVRAPTRVLRCAEHSAWPFPTAVAEAIPGAEYHEVAVTERGDSLGLAWKGYAQHIAEVARGVDSTYGDSDRVLATVLFTDIVGSTDQLSRLGDVQWAAVLEDHDRMLRRQVARCGGRYVGSTGDGALCEFSGPAAAVESGQAVCSSASALRIEIRAGVHTGECSRRGEDLAGLAVHIGARVCAAAGPGEVVVSRTVRDLVAGSTLAFSTRGEHDLKGVPGSWELFAVGTDAAPSTLSAPSPRPADRVVVGLSRRAPGAVRAANRFATAVQKRRFDRQTAV